MLTKHVAVRQRKKRTSRRQPTEEGIALKELRQAKGFSMRQLGAMVGKSDSYISHLENGRLDFPDGEPLVKILTALGGMKPKSFFERARNCRIRVYQENFVIQWLRRANDGDLATVYELLSPP